MKRGAIEFYVNNGEAFAEIDGQRMLLSDAPVNVHEMIRRNIEHHPGAIEALESMGLNSASQQHEQYIACMYGEYNHTPDFLNFRHSVDDDEFTQLLCGVNNCKFRGVLCHKIHAKYSDLTDREVQICLHIRADFSSKEIADMLDISINTVSVHIANILSKIGCNSRAGIASWASTHLA